MRRSGPAQLQAAYSLPSSTAGSGQTVAIVDAYNDPNTASDLAAYRSAVNSAVSLGAKYVSNSYGGSEDATDPA